MTPRASIVTRTHERLHFLQRAVDALVQQESGPYEWVLVQEGGVSQEMAEVIATMQRAGWQVRHIYNPVPVGRAKAANAGVEAASCDLAIIHDDDDYLLPAALDRLVGALETHRDWIAVCCRYKIAHEAIVDKQIVAKGEMVDGPIEPLDLLSLAERNRYPPIVQMFRRDLFLKAGGYDSARTVLEDWLLNVRLAMLGTIGQIDDVLAVYSLRPGAKTEDANSVITEVKEHEESEAKIRHETLMLGIANGTADLGTILALGHLARMVNKQEGRFLKVRQIANHFPWVERAIRRLLK